MDDSPHDGHEPFGSELARSGYPHRHRLPAASFEQLCGGPVAEATMALLERSQYSQRKLALRALIQQLEHNPDAVGPLVLPDQAWRILAAAERRDPAAVREILLYPPVGVWLRRALHHTRREQTCGLPWTELGYLQLIAAAAAVSCRVSCVVRVPVWHGVVTLPTVGQVRLPTRFPIGTAEVHHTEHGTRVLACGGRVSVDLHPDVRDRVFSPAKRQVSTARGLTMVARIEDLDPYRGFGDPQPPTELDQPSLAEWRKMLDEAWEALTVWHPDYARELSAGLRALIPIRRDLGIVGASSPAAFGGIILSAAASAIELAETLVHELQHSKLNALMELIELTHDDDRPRHYAPWRDDPRPLTALLHGIYAFTCGVEFLRDLAYEADSGHVEFAFAYRRAQVRATINWLREQSNLTEPGRQLLIGVEKRLATCECAPVSTELRGLVDLICTNHSALWRLWNLRPDPAVVESVRTAWFDGAVRMDVPASHDPLVVASSRPLPAARDNLLRTKAVEPERFARLTRRPMAGTAAHADLALALGDHRAAVESYQNQLRVKAEDLESWVGLGLAMRAQGHIRPAAALLEWPELTLAVYQRIRRPEGRTPDPAEFVHWLGRAS